MSHNSKQREFIPLKIAILTVSDSRTEKDDTSGKVLVDRLQEAGHSLAEKAIVPDDIYQIRSVVSRWIADPDIEAVISTGIAARGRHYPMAWRQKDKGMADVLEEAGIKRLFWKVAIKRTINTY